MKTSVFCKTALL